MFKQQWITVFCATFLTVGAATATAGPRQQTFCSCASGRMFKVGMLTYLERGDRLRVANIIADEKTNKCVSMEIDRAELFPMGQPEKGFYVERRISSVTESDPCSPKTARFVDRDTRYIVDFKKDSYSIRSIKLADVVPATQNVSSSSVVSNSNAWNAIQVQKLFKGKIDRLVIDPTRPYNRTSWVMAPQPIQAYQVGISKDSVKGNQVVRVKRKQVRSGLLGQIEIVGDQFALVRFYKRSLNERYGITKVFADWYEGLGRDADPPETGLYTTAHVEILEVPLNSIMELNDYFDRLHINTTSTSLEKKFDRNEFDRKDVTKK